MANFITFELWKEGGGTALWRLDLDTGKVERAGELSKGYEDIDPKTTQMIIDYAKNNFQASMVESLPVAQTLPKQVDRIVCKWKKSGEYWDITFRDEKGRFAHRIGFQFIHHLLKYPGKEIPALTVYYGGVGPQNDESELDYQEIDEESETIDGLVIKRYEELSAPNISQNTIDQCEYEIAEIDRELSKKDLSRHKQSEMVQLEKRRAELVAILKREFDKPATIPIEGARKDDNIWHAIKNVYDLIGVTMPACRKHLKPSIKTGQVCIYDPPGDSNITWDL